MRKPVPRQDWVILQDKDEKRRIILAGDETNMSTPKVVVAVGPGRYENGALVPMQSKVGDEVLFIGNAIGKKIDDEGYWLVRDEHIQGIIIDDGVPKEDADGKGKKSRLVLQ